MNISKTRYEPLREKTGFAVPHEYLTLHEEGRLRYGKDQADWQQNSDTICLSAPPALICCPFYWCVEWYTAKEMLEWKPPEYWKRIPLVAFAGSGYGDEWCWLPQRSGPLGTPVAFCRHDENDSEIFAPNFVGFLYRGLLESYAYIPYDNLIEYGGDTSMYRRFLRLCTDNLARFFPSAWSQSLSELLDRPFAVFDPSDSEIHGLLSQGELESILSAEPLLSGINEHFQHMEP